MQGRLFVVPWGKDYFIKVLRVLTHVCVCVCVPPGPGNHSHMYWLRRSLGLLRGRRVYTHTFWVSRKRSLATLLMNPSVIFQLSRGYQAKKLLSVTWQENPSSPESLLSPEPSAARASLLCRAIMPSTLSTVKFRCVCVCVLFFPE